MRARRTPAHRLSRGAAPGTAPAAAPSSPARATGVVAVAALGPASVRPALPSWRSALDAIWAALEDGATERFSLGGQGGAGSPGGRSTRTLERDVAERARITALVELAQGGDREAFAQLYDAYVDT